MTKYILSFFGLLLANIVNAQHINGTIYSSDNKALDGATVRWLDGTVGAYSNTEGKFDLEPEKGKTKIIASFLGFQNDTISIKNTQDKLKIVLKSVLKLDEVTIAAKRQDQFVSTLKTRNVESVNSLELKNAPCCSLAESFETNATVDVVQTDAVTGTKEIQMLGLKGLYTQILLENRPDLSGIASSYSMDFIPGSWIEAIQISKGASTVANGYQSITGQINVELVKPFSDKAIFVNGFANHEGRYEANVHLNHNYHSPWSQGLLLHTSGQQFRGDQDEDGFIDNVLRSTYTGMYRLFYSGSIINAQFNALVLDDNRKSGQFAHDSELDSQGSYYHILQNNKRYEAFGKVAYLGLKGKQESIGFQWHAFQHQLDNTFGLRDLAAKETEMRATLLYKNNLINDDNTITAGITGIYNKSNQSFDGQNIDLNDNTGGLHAEYTYGSSVACEEDDKPLFWKNFGLILGMRLDNHATNGWFVVPRLNLKYNFTDNSIVRLSAGRGLRRGKPFTDYINRMANNKQWVVEPDLQLEDAWNLGGNFTQNFTVAERSGQLTVDLYNVNFKNQMILDADADIHKILVYNLKGKSHSTTLQIAGQYELLNGLNLRAAYKYSQVEIDYQKGYRQAIFIPKDRWLFNLNYKTSDKKWIFNTIANYTGTMRLPDSGDVPSNISNISSDNTKAYWRFDFQVTRSFANFEIYSGVENITDYRQDNPILQNDMPFGEYFDAGRVYAPLNGRMFNIGFRYWIDQKHTSTNGH